MSLGCRGRRQSGMLLKEGGAQALGSAPRAEGDSHNLPVHLGNLLFGVVSVGWGHLGAPPPTRARQGEARVLASCEVSISRRWSSVKWVFWPWVAKCLGICYWPMRGRVGQVLALGGLWGGGSLAFDLETLSQPSSSCFNSTFQSLCSSDVAVN